MKKNLTKIFTTLIVAGLLAVGVSYVTAQTASTPTNGPADPASYTKDLPVHTGTGFQMKHGGIFSRLFLGAPLALFREGVFLPGDQSALRIGSSTNQAIDLNSSVFNDEFNEPLILDLNHRSDATKAIRFTHEGQQCTVATRWVNDKNEAFEFKNDSDQANVIARQLQLTGGNPGSGKVLVADAGGNARWATATVQNGQIVFSSGTSPVPAGQCVTPSGPTPTDLCTNIAGVQETVPSGMTKDTPGDTPGVCTTPAVDQCPNIAGTQTSVPAGMIVDASGNCITPPTDLCTNIAGVQSTIPTGYEIRNDRCGIWQVLDMFPIPFQDYYGTHDAWVGYKGYNWLDSLQNISVKNSMMNYTSTPNELRAIRVPKASGYGFQPTTILETYNVGQVLYEDTRSGYRNCLINSIETSPGSNWVASEACDDGSGTGALWREFRMELFHDKF